MSYLLPTPPVAQSDSGMVTLTSNTSGLSFATAANSSVAALGLSFTPLFSGDYRIHLRLHCNLTVSGNGVIVILDANGGGAVAVPGSECLVARPSGSTGEYGGGGTFTVSLVAGTQYDLRFFNPAGDAGFALLSNANGRSTMTWEKV